jgi:LDH2 family malate/lactate/ureidoglycolate dehydrogenase
VVLTGVLHTAKMNEIIEACIQEEGREWAFFALGATSGEIARRIRGDTKVQEPAARLSWLHLNDRLSIPGRWRYLDTTLLGAVDVAKQIAGLVGPPEGRDAAVGAEDVDRVQVDRSEVCRVGARILCRLGVSSITAERTIADLVTNETDQHQSHGLLQLPFYVEGIRKGVIKPSARPTSITIGNSACLVDGQRSLAVLTADQVQHEMRRLLSTQPVGIVGLINSSHVGRLASVVRPLCNEGLFVLGFANYLGTGRRVAPWGGSEERFSTNPIVFGIPGREEPIVFDMATSAVAEGVVRLAALAGRHLGPGVLVDSEFLTVTDPRLLYTAPPQAMLAPLGGVAGYKGFGLGLVAEVLAGVVTGAGFVAQPAAAGGNGGLFVGFRPDILGRSVDAVIDDVERLTTQLESCRSALGFTKVRIPGRRSKVKTDPTDAMALEVDQRVWNAIVALDGGDYRRRVPTPAGSLLSH